MASALQGVRVGVVAPGMRIELDDPSDAEEPGRGIPQPLSGWVHLDTGGSHRFVGYVDLISHIESIRRPPAEAVSGTGGS